MTDLSAPPHEFDDSRATIWFPRPVVKWAVLVPIPDDFPTFIQPEWNATSAKPKPQIFYGSYYLMLDEFGRGRYGSAAIQWENMHTQLDVGHLVTGVPAAAYVKTEVPTGYCVFKRCTISTSVPLGGGHVFESDVVIEPGTLILRQSGGEIQHVRPADLTKTYFLPKEAEELGLRAMLDAGEFPDWAYDRAMESICDGIRV